MLDVPLLMAAAACCWLRLLAGAASPAAASLTIALHTSSVSSRPRARRICCAPGRPAHTTPT
jgi:hypothetical protein